MKDVLKYGGYYSMNFRVTHIELQLDISTIPAESKSTLTIEPLGSSSTLVLDGEHMDLISIVLDGKPLSDKDYEIKADTLIIKNAPTNKPFTLTTTTHLKNPTDFLGLYETKEGIFVNAERGLGRVLYCIDSPDNNATFTTTIIANKQDYPDIFCNGIRTSYKTLQMGLHSITYLDEVPKPTYLFTLAAGAFDFSLVTYLNRNKEYNRIEIYSPKWQTHKSNFAKQILTKAMSWYEDNYGLACNVPDYKVIVANHFASEATGTAGLTAINAEQWHCTSDTTTDLGTIAAARSIVQAFFNHGVRDSKVNSSTTKISFKEHLDYFQTELFLKELYGSDIIKIFERKRELGISSASENVYASHAELEKSSHVLRMIRAINGKTAFNKILGSFLKQIQGRSFTIYELLTAFEFEKLKPNIETSGKPTVHITETYNAEEKTYTLNVSVTGRKGRILCIPYCLFDDKADEHQKNMLLTITEDQHTINFKGYHSKPILSILREGSKMAEIKFKYTPNAIRFLMRGETNPFARCEAKNLLISKMVQLYCEDGKILFSKKLFEVYKFILEESTLSPLMLAELLSIPTEEELISKQSKPNFKQIAQARLTIQKEIATQLKDQLFALYNNAHSNSLSEKANFVKQAGNRRLALVCHSYLRCLNEDNTKRQLLVQLNDDSGKNMAYTTDTLAMLCEIGGEEVSAALNAFYQKWKDDAQVINIWLKIQAAAHSSQVLEPVAKLLEHPAFNIQDINNVQALIGTFIKNPYGFHHESGLGYKLVAKCIVEIDKTNPTLAAALAEAFVWVNLDEFRKNAMTQQLAYMNSKDISDELKSTVTQCMKSSKLPVHLMLLGKEVQKNTPEVNPAPGLKA